MKSKKLISVVLTLAMVLGLLPAVSLPVYADGNLDSGFQLCKKKDANNNVIAKWNSDKSVLIISGKGLIDYYKWVDMAKLINPKYAQIDIRGHKFWGNGIKEEIEETFDIKFQSESASNRIKFPEYSVGMFSYFSRDIDFGTYGVDTSEVLKMSCMFDGAKSFNSPVNFDTRNVRLMFAMFRSTESFNQPVNFDTRKVQDMSEMFNKAESFNQPVNFDTSDVEYMTGMFCRATSFNQPVNFDNTSNVQSMNAMFSGANSFNQNIDFDISACNKIKYMFANSGINNKSIILRNSEYNSNIKAGDAFKNIKPSYLEFSGLKGYKVEDEAYPLMITGFSGDYRVEKDGKFVAEHKADEAYAFDDSAHYKVYLKPEEENEEDDEEDDEEKIKTEIYFDFDDLEKYYDGKPFVFEDLLLGAMTSSNAEKVAGTITYDKNKFANAINIGEYKIEFKFVPDDKKYAEATKELTFIIKENPLKDAFPLNDAKTVFAKFEGSNLLITGYGRIKYWKEMAQLINEKYFSYSVRGWDKDTDENFDIIIKPDSGKEIYTKTTILGGGFIGVFEGFSGNIIFDKNFKYDGSGVAFMQNMFKDATKFNQDLSHWDLSNPAMLDDFFTGATSFDNKGKQFVLDLTKYPNEPGLENYEVDMFKGTKLKDLKVINNSGKNMNCGKLFNGMNSIENLEFNGLKNVSIDWLSDKYGIIDVDSKKEIEDVKSYKFEDGKSYKVYLKNSKYDEKASEEAKKKAEEEKKKKEEEEAKKKAEEDKKKADDKKKAKEDKNKSENDGNKAEFNIKFDDVKEGKYYTEAVYYVAKNGIMKGTGDNKFSPKKPIRKGQLVTMLFRLSKDPEPSIKNTSNDVKSGKYYEKPLLWASTKGICEMDKDNRFYPNEELDRESFVVIMYNYAKYKKYGLDKKADLSKYSDLSQVKNKEAMEWAVGNGIIKGTGKNVLSPNKKTNRAQMATVFMRFMQKFVDKK